MSGCIDDQGLIDACLAGKTEAFGVLVRRYQDRLYPTLLHVAGCAEDAHDLLQDTFLRAYEKLGRFHGESSFYTWIYRIGVNLALSSRRRRRPLLMLGDASTDLPADPAFNPEDSDPAGPLVRQERERIVRDALHSLAPDHRVVVVMKEFDGLRYDEIAAMLGIPVGTVRSRLHRARSELRELLRALVDEELPVRHAVPERR
jgi:RNA polymerase sigma-70 factor (ECF subfamily)